MHALRMSKEWLKRLRECQALFLLVRTLAGNDIIDMIDIFVDVEVCAEVGVDKTSATKYLAIDCLVTA